MSKCAVRRRWFQQPSQGLVWSRALLAEGQVPAGQPGRGCWHCSFPFSVSRSDNGPVAAGTKIEAPGLNSELRSQSSSCFSAETSRSAVGPPRNWDPVCPHHGVHHSLSQWDSLQVAGHRPSMEAHPCCSLWPLAWAPPIDRARALQWQPCFIVKGVGKSKGWFCSLRKPNGREELGGVQWVWNFLAVEADWKGNLTRTLHWPSIQKWYCSGQGHYRGLLGGY